MNLSSFSRAWSARKKTRSAAKTRRWMKTSANRRNRRNARRNPAEAVDGFLTSWDVI